MFWMRWVLRLEGRFKENEKDKNEFNIMLTSIYVRLKMRFLFMVYFIVNILF